MNQSLRRIMSLQEIRYGWLLLLSFILFGFSFYNDRIIDPIDEWGSSIGYGISFAIAAFWGAINYISHIRMNAMYKKELDISIYVQQLEMSKEDQLELQTYLEDYVQDLIEQGFSKEDATKEAINQFKVKEILSKNTMLFNLHAHFYLIGWVAIFFIALILVWLTEHSLNIESNYLLLIEVPLFVYCLGISGVFLLYKVIDSIIYQKYKELFS